jgi:hydrogenase maturation protein HypF
MDSQASGSNLNTNRLRVRVRGLVQGVGFRPHVYKLALDCQLVGWVRNDGEGVILEVEGRRAREFLSRLVLEKPPLSRIDSVETANAESPSPHEAAFLIVESEQTAITTSIVPDAATCEACLAESLNKNDRRYDYSFLNCTHCGPRYTITKQLPYDRRQTSMANFPMCPACENEYRDPLDRRFHAQPTACPVCGPELSETVASVVSKIRAGKIVAIKGLGGFHLACDATNEKAVSSLRERKNREAKPFALMVGNLATAKRMVEVCAVAKELLQGSLRPIVVLPQRQNSEISLAHSVAPGMNSLGVMLPYTPLQHLIFHEAAKRPSFEEYNSQAQNLVLVMTSANPGGEPLVIDNSEAHERLSSIADSIVTHNRDIVVRVDDSVARVVHNAPYFIRRARGCVPQAIKLPREVPCILAFGADLKNTICITRGNEAFVSQHIGDLDNVATIEFLRETTEHLLSILAVEPQLVACDLHPDFQTTRLAADWQLPTVRVQHHHAHIAAVAIEHGVTEPVLGMVLDGFGLGTDGLLWGGELLHVHGAQFQRLGNFRPLAQPGGDKASREPWRMAAAALHDMGRNNEIASRFSNNPLAQPLAQMLNANLNSPPTSSCGRLFDAACGLANIKLVADYEGEAPMLFESMVQKFEKQSGLWSISQNLEIDWRSLLARVASEPSQQRAAEVFHGALVCGLTEWAIRASERTQIKTIALAGGCFLNHILITELVAALQQHHLKVLVPRILPPNDGGISLGQAWIAANTH